jgi:alpha-glucosidase (family GH31 glycosyl hydrolase)
LVFGAGPRLRPVLTNDASGRFTWNRATFQDNASLVDDVVQRVLRSA